MVSNEIARFQDVSDLDGKHNERCDGQAAAVRFGNDYQMNSLHSKRGRIFLDDEASPYRAKETKEADNAVCVTLSNAKLH
jgi:hypothetical protein